ncbi:tenascin-like [Saccostrea echinata]|uniref:tenascin-like n=1 Tax=Saccostrea echinata TaxID=191078 RepID=UPI002A83ADA4|nr:tenascin-like [Saccostrea echinata]
MKMWSIQMLLFSFALFMQFQFSSAQILFGNCTTNAECPPYSECVDGQCECEEGYFPQDAPADIEGLPLTLCIASKCDPLDENACNGDGYCVVGAGRIYCVCDPGYTGVECETKTSTMMTTSTTTTSTTTRKVNILPAVLGGGAGLITLAAIAAALASSSG